MAISDKQFDSQFDKVANLTHYPWIGSGYASAPKRVLIMGDSHYTIDGNTKEFCQEEYDRCISDKEYTRGIIGCEIGTPGSWPFHKYLEKTFLDEANMNVETFWTKVASYNFIQEPMKSIHEEPSHADYETAWKCFANVAQIIKPNICIFVGLRNNEGIDILDEINVKHSIRYFDTNVDNSWPMVGDLQFEDGYKLPFYMIHHTAQYYSPQEWYDFLNKEIPEVVSFLGK